jgi:hypothetical protein
VNFYGHGAGNESCLPGRCDLWSLVSGVNARDIWANSVKRSNLDIIALILLDKDRKIKLFTLNKN